jgi:hypothetical protein
MKNKREKTCVSESLIVRFSNCVCENGGCVNVNESRKLSLNVNVKVWDNVEDFVKCEHGGFLCT